MKLIELRNKTRIKEQHLPKQPDGNNIGAVCYEGSKKRGWLQSIEAAEVISYRPLVLFIKDENVTTRFYLYFRFPARYLWWSVYSTVAPLTLQKFRDLGFQFSQRVYGLKEKTPRWKGCTGNVNTNFGTAISYVYVQKHFNENSREKVEQ